MQSIIDKLKTRKVRPSQVFRLGLIILVEGIIYPTSDPAKIPVRREVVGLVMKKSF